MSSNNEPQDAEKAVEAEESSETTGSSLLDRLGDKIFGPTAESETSNAPVIAPVDSAKPRDSERRR